MTEVVLTWHEMAAAAAVGVQRQIRAMRSGLTDKHGLDPDNGWNVHIVGAQGEMAFCKATGVYWPASIDRFKLDADVGPCEIRTRTNHSYDLLIREDDADRPFILVTCEPPVFRIHGWIKASEARSHSEWVKTHGGREPAWFVPSSELEPLETMDLELVRAW